MSATSEVRGRIAELFTSLQGEGVTAGVPSVFIRLQGCSVGCVWCDTKYSWDPTKGELWTVEGILEKIALTSLKNVVVTGGEPLESPLFVPLVSALKAQGYRVEVETSGVLEPPNLPVDQWNVSIKLAHSSVPEEKRIRPNAIHGFVARDAWFKFVVAQPEDVDEVLELQKRCSLPQERILLMPEGADRHALIERSRWVWEACQSHGFRFSPRLHILLFGAKRGV